MADKKTSVKYKFGQKELDMDKYLKNIGHNVQSYLEDRRKRGWTDDLVQEFSTAYNRYMDAFKLSMIDNDNRFSTDDLGNITDMRGEFTNIDNDDDNGTQYYYNDKGERITNTDYDALKDRKKKKYKTFNANRLVAEYFRTIGKAMDTAKPAEDEKFDLSKHGFVAWWNQKYNPAGGSVNLKPFLDKDPVGTDGKRPVSNRAKMAAGWMNEYLDWLKDKNLDYSKYEQFGDYDNYATKGRELAQKWNDGVWDADDLIAGQAFGISNDFSEGFFTTEEDPNLTPEQREAKEAAAKQKEEQAKADQITKNKQAWIDQQIAAFNNSNPAWTQENPYSSTFDRGYWYNDDGTLNQENYYSAWGSNFLNPTTGKIDAGILDSYMNGFVQNPFDAKYKNDIARNIVGLIQSGAAQQISGGDLEGMYYIPSRSDEQYNRALVFDPNTRSLFYTFIGNVPSQWKRRTDKWNLDNGISQPSSRYMFEEGGVIETMQLGGNFGNSFVEGRNAYVKSKADAQGLTTEQYEARNRRPGGDKNALEQNNGWTANDSLRVGAILGDLTSMGLAFTPATIASSAVGAGSTTAHLIADIGEDGLDWGDAGRALFGYSMDALGLIPGVGGVTKAAKIGRAIKVVAPKVIAAIGTAGTLANSGAILGSLKKAMGDEKLTVEDFRNITQGLMFVMGGTGAAARKIHTMRGGKGTLAQGPQGTTNSVALQIRNKKTGNVETRTFNADQAKAIKEAKDNTGISTAAKLGKDEELVTTTSLRPRFQWIRENGKWRSPIHTAQNKAEIMPVRLGHDGKYYAKRGQFNTDIAVENTAPGLQTQLNDFRTNTGVTKSVAELKAIQKKLGKTQSDYNEKVKTINAELSKLKSAKTPDRKLIRAKLKELRDAREAVKTIHRQVSPNASWMSLSFKNKEKKLNEYIESIKGLETQLGQANKNWSELVSGTNTSTGVREAFRNILREYGSYKEGGKFEGVRRYKLGNPITNVQGNANWFDHMYKHKSMQNWLGTWNVNNYLDFNKLQDSWVNNLKVTGYNPNDPALARGEGDAQSNAVLERQKLWNATGTNAAIEDANTLGILTRNGGTSDNLAGQYLDGYFGAQEYLRHGGTNFSWQGHDAELAAQQEAFKKQGLEYYLDENGMYKLRPLNTAEDPQNLDDPQNQGTTVNPEGNGGEGPEPQGNKPGINIGKFVMDPRIAAIAHNMYANTVNDIMTDRSIDAARRSLTLYDPKNTTKYLQGNLDAEMQGERAAGQLMHMASQPMTSDGALQTAAYMDSASKAQDYIIQGRTINNEALRKSAEELWQLRKEDDDFNYNVAMRNRQSISDLIDNIANLENARDSKRYTNNSVLFDEIMQPVKQEANRKRNLEERLAMSDIHNDVRYNLGKYTHLTADEEEAWNAIISGDKQFSELGGTDAEAKKRLQRAYLNAERKASEIEQDRMANYYGVSRSYRNVREMAQGDTPWRPDLPSAKDGAKITVAKIRERTKDADRFHKTTKDKQDRNEKAIARADKKMYSRRDFIKRGKK